MIYFVFALSLYSLAGSLIMQTKDFKSSLVFKVIPFFLSLGTLIYVLKFWEVI